MHNITITFNVADESNKVVYQNQQLFMSADSTAFQSLLHAYEQAFKYQTPAQVSIAPVEIKK